MTVRDGEPGILRSPLGEGARRSLPAALPVFVFGIAFGVVAREAGMSAAAAVAMSLTTFGGSAQFAAASILDGDGSWITAVLAAGALNARYLALGLVIAPALAWLPRWRQFVALQLVIDESWAVAQTRRGIDAGLLLGAGLTIYVGWVVGTAIGVIAGDVLDPEQLGLDAMLPALFLVLLRPHLVDTLSRQAAVVAALLAGALLLVLPPGVALLLAAGGAMALVRMRGRR